LVPNDFLCKNAFWNGEPNAVASRLDLPGIVNLNNVESID